MAIARVAIVVVAAFALVLLTSGLVAAAVVRETPATSQARPPAGKLSLSQLGGAEGLAEDVRSSGAGAAARSQPAPPLPGHRTPGAVVTPFGAGRTEWSGVSHGISLRLVMTPASPRAGEPVTFVAESSMPGALCCNLILQFGDGATGVLAFPEPLRPPPPIETVPWPAPSQAPPPPPLSSLPLAPPGPPPILQLTTTTSTP